jgi:hypothetical protein
MLYKEKNYIFTLSFSADPSLQLQAFPKVYAYSNTRIILKFVFDSYQIPII